MKKLQGLMLKAYICFFEPIRHLFILRTTGRIGGLIVALITALFWKLSWVMMVFIVTSVVSDTYFFLIKKLKESDFKAFDAKCQALYFKSENYNKYALALTWSKITVLALWLMLGVKYTDLTAVFPVLAIPYSITMLIVTPILMFATGAGSKATLIDPQPSCPYAMQSQTATGSLAMTRTNDFMQPIDHITASSSFTTYEFHVPTVPNAGMPGFDINGTHTGSDTAIGGVSC